MKSSEILISLFFDIFFFFHIIGTVYILIPFRPLYESYRSRCCFWEALPMLRKLLNIAVTDIYPLR